MRPQALADGTVSAFGGLGRFQMVGAAGCGVTSPDASLLEYKSGQPVNYAGDIENVFACLAGNLGTVGCGQEHQLQAFEFALAAKGIGNDEQQKFLRPNAYLGLVFVSDEDVVRRHAERNTPLVPGTKIGMQCWTCTDTIPGIPPSAGCDY